MGSQYVRLLEVRLRLPSGLQFGSMAFCSASGDCDGIHSKWHAMISRE